MTTKKKPAPPKKKPAAPAKIKGKAVKTRKDGKPSRVISHKEKVARQSIGNPKKREKPVELAPREKGQITKDGKRGPYCESRKVGDQIFHRPKNAESKSGRIWRACDSIKAKGRDVIFNDVVAAVGKDIPKPTIASQICFWRAFNGVEIPQHAFKRGHAKAEAAKKAVVKKPAPPVVKKKPAKPAAPVKKVAPKPTKQVKKPSVPKKPAPPVKKPAAPVVAAPVVEAAQEVAKPAEVANGQPA